MKIKFIADIPMTAKGIAYTKGNTYDVADKEGQRLVATFPTKFEAIVVVKATPKPEPKPKPTPKPKEKTEAKKD